MSLASQSDGKILVSGGFTTLNGQARTNIGRLNADGTLDLSYNPGASGIVYTLMVQPDDKVVAGGRFTTLGGQSVTNLGRLNVNGTLDSAFAPTVSFYVQGTALQADGRIIVGGAFFSPLAARFYSDGSPDFSFSPSFSGSSPIISDLTIQEDGGILVGGTFSAVNGVPRSYISRLYTFEAIVNQLSYDGAVISWERTGPLAEIQAVSFDVSTNGTDWTTVGPGTRTISGWQRDIAGLPSNATIRGRGVAFGGRYNGSSWLVELGIGPAAISLQPLGRTNNPITLADFSVWATGDPTLTYQWRKNGVDLTDGGRISGAFSSHLYLTNVLGGDAGSYTVVVSNDFGSVTSLVANLTVVDPLITNQPISKSVLVGQSATFTVQATGTSPLSYQWRKEKIPLAGKTAATLNLSNLQVQDAGIYDVLVTNQFGSQGSSNALLTVNSVYPEPSFPTANNPVSALAIQPDGRILAGGSFFVIAGQSRRNAARFNAEGTLDFAFDPAPSSTVSSFAIQPDGKILTAGTFSAIGSDTHNYIGRINTNGSPDNTFNPSANDYLKLLLQPDGRIVIGGRFTTLDGQPRNRLGRLNSNGTLDATFDPGADNEILTLALQDDGKILVGGTFANLGGQLHASLGRINTNGIVDATFNPAFNADVDCISIQPDGKIIVGGGFTTVNGVLRSRICRLQADGSLDLGFNPNANGVVRTLALQADGKLILGGDFTTVGGESRNRVARLNSDGSLDTNFNPGATGTSFPGVYSLCVQPDGKILVGGSFTNLGALTSTLLCFGRLTNTGVATQQLAFDGSTITWLRDGSSPEVWRTTFESSSDGTNWTFLGAGIRQTGGWQLANATVQSASMIRARGFVTSGLNNASSWFVETNLQIAPTQPIILVNDSQFGFQSNRFGFNLRATAGQIFVIQASTNLVTWTPIQTNVASPTGLILFRDSNSGLYPRRFYRASLYQGLLPPPSIIGTDGNLGIRSGHFGFNLAGIIGQTLVVETSTNLLSWTPLSTNILSAPFSYFSDTFSGFASQRFYRVRGQ
jgi:uncharacterized delta-60 repeat protein